MSEVTATDAARNFADLLDAVEHRGEHFTVVRRGRVVARLEPARPADAAELRKVLRRHRPDPSWRDDLGTIRDLLEIEERA